MGSVIATWRAHTTDALVQNSLAEYLQKLGRHQQLRRAQSTGGEVPAFSKMLTVQRSEGLPPISQERFFQNQAIQGKVVVSPDLFPETPAKAESSVELSTSGGRPPAFPDRASAIADAEARGLRVIRENNIPFVIIEKATLFGVDFRIFDPRDLYPGEDRMSFVFVRGSGWPLLDGRMVNVDDTAGCRQYRHHVLQSADWHLSLPYVHLRYFLEEWSDRLFAWMRRYFIPELEFTRYESNTEFPVHESCMVEMEQELGQTEARERWFDKLLAEYDSELGGWQIDLASWARQETGPPTGHEPS